jgi:hypothetical protein
MSVSLPRTRDQGGEQVAESLTVHRSQPSKAIPSSPSGAHGNAAGSFKPPTQHHLAPLSPQGLLSASYSRSLLS